MFLKSHHLLRVDGQVRNTILTCLLQKKKKAIPGKCNFREAGMREKVRQRKREKEYKGVMRPQF